MKVRQVWRAVAAIGASGLLAVLLPTAARAQTGGENAAQRLTRSGVERQHDLASEKILYCVGYAHLDTQWRWDFPITIDRYIRDTLEQNFERFERYPEYTFNFTGSARYEMMKEYYPEHYQRLKDYIRRGRWIVSGSSVDEGDVNVPSSESIIRQVLYGNRFFKREFGKESADYMLPDCFGFPASLPSIWAHCGLLGFSTQKLTWGSAVGIPFGVGVWEGPDGNGVLAALDPGSYVGAIQGRVERNDKWVQRIETNGRRFGVFADYHYYGVGDQGGAPREEDIRNYIAGMGHDDALFRVSLAASDQLYKDVTPDQRDRLPRYKGDMLLTEHSAGTLTSQAYMKRWNRKCEQLADAAERAAVAAHWLGGADYPRDKLERAWVRFLANQMHDILPGTSIPRAYTWSWNDELVAMNLFAEVLTDSVAAWSQVLDTRADGVALVVYNLLVIEGTDVVEAEVPLAGTEHVRVIGPDGVEVPSQLLGRTKDTVRVLFAAAAPSVGLATYDVRPSSAPYREADSPLRVGIDGVENSRYRVSIDDRGDITSILDKRLGRELLAGPHRLVFTHESPRQWPAWNMDWEDRSQPPLGHVDGPPTVRIIEDGPLRVALRIARESRGSEFVQTIRLTHGADDDLVRVDMNIDWQTAGAALKAAFPLAVSNPNATYNWGLGTIERSNNDPKKFEVPSHEWFDLTDASGEFGVSILEDCKYGSDKPVDNQVRLTLLYSPEVEDSFQDQHSQDWGKHEVTYALLGHAGDWRQGRSAWHARRLNQPLRVFVSPKHDGTEGRRTSLLAINSPRVDVRVVKLGEDRDEMIVRLQELWGVGDEDVRVRFGTGIESADEVDGQERRLAKARIDGAELETDLGPYSPRAFAIRPTPPIRRIAKPTSHPVDLVFDEDVVSFDRDRTDGAIDAVGRTMPAEMLPDVLTVEGITFKLGPNDDGNPNALACRGQSIQLPSQPGNRIVLLACASGESEIAATFRVGTLGQHRTVQPWTGFIGQWDNRVWESEPPEMFYSWDGRVVGISPGYIRRDPIAWFATHRHHPTRGNEAYRFSYLFKYELERPEGTTRLTLPDDFRIKVFAATLCEDPHAGVGPAAALYDEFSPDRHVRFRHSYPPAEVSAFSGLEPTGRVVFERASSVARLVIGPPSSRDFADSSSNNGVVFRAVDPAERFPPHPKAGLTDGGLPRLHDGLLARHDDDTNRCVWYDQEGRLYADLGKPTGVSRINTYSWHVSNRAPQYFSLWGARGSDLPNPAFGADERGQWELLAVVDTRGLGSGGVHASSVLGTEGDLGPYRFLLWIAEDVGQGTFFMEIDVHAAE